MPQIPTSPSLTITATPYQRGMSAWRMKGEKKEGKDERNEKEREREAVRNICTITYFFPPRKAVIKWSSHSNSMLVAWPIHEEGAAHLSHCAELSRLGVGSSSGKGVVSGSHQQFDVSFILFPLFQKGILYMIVSCQRILLLCRWNRLGYEYALLPGCSTKDYWEIGATFQEGLIYSDNVIPPQILLLATGVERVSLVFQGYCWETVYFVKVHGFMGH